jgi:amino acid transporter
MYKIVFFSVAYFAVSIKIPMIARLMLTTMLASYLYFRKKWFVELKEKLITKIVYYGVGAIFAIYSILFAGIYTEFMKSMENPLVFIIPFTIFLAVLDLSILFVARLFYRWLNKTREMAEDHGNETKLAKDQIDFNKEDEEDLEVISEKCEIEVKISA